MPRLRLTLAASGAAALLLSACAGGGGPTVITHETLGINYSADYLREAQSYDAVPIEVVGAPDAARQDTYDEVVLDAFRTSGRTNAVSWTLPPAGGDAPYRMVVLTNPAGNLTGNAVCRGDTRTQEASNGTVRTLLAFCLGDRRSITSLRARKSGITGVDDPALKNLFQQATVSLFPLIDTNRGRDADDGGDFF